ncbi:hypothetical protein [Streptomyces sp. NBC_00620]|uniref:hypothetical protein n=1 Tax=Streptomyces sp. NBC_00620 TaxID=2903666 RepID=UPI00224CB8E3|nr:hypothetical protein [Streptomyces sp. NBC_00620]MCX4976493.1 hypothetical protein [Streptomyces sp. NBC_00620]
MTANPVHTYLVTNPSTLFDPKRVIEFESSAPIGSVREVEIDGRPVRILLTGIPLNGGLRGAELQVTYL